MRASSVALSIEFASTTDASAFSVRDMGDASSPVRRQYEPHQMSSELALRRCCGWIQFHASVTQREKSRVAAAHCVPARTLPDGHQMLSGVLASDLLAMEQ